MKDATLAQHPDFTLRRSTALTGVFVALALLALLGFVLAITHYGELAQTESVSWRGRSTTALAGIVAPASVGLSAFAAFLFAWLALSNSTRWVRTSTGTKLRGIELVVAGDGAIGDELYRRLSTGDPAQYLPIPVAKKGELRVHIYRADADRRAFITIEQRSGAEPRTWPLIELADRGYVQIKRRNAEDFAKPYVAA
ncbi:hypothetical protein KZC51_04200 [Microbacterium sp. SSW1-49]|uniref:Uncharacterized protein n=1 Tax=Microbacterium croceum TaxID=2851645 RepID=A0ABT0FB94_9MICO|nr:hypothetical protein [Microbacterium croceum]MCK2035331.1 hypothetical protein [Microbacterium croceum]